MLKDTIHPDKHLMSCCPCRAGMHGAKLQGRQHSRHQELSEFDTDTSCEDTDGSDDTDDSPASSDLGSGASCEVSELRDTADSKLCRPYSSRHKRKRGEMAKSTLIRCCNRHLDLCPVQLAHTVWLAYGIMCTT